MTRESGVKTFACLGSVVRSTPALGDSLPAAALHPLHTSSLGPASSLEMHVAYRCTSLLLLGQVGSNLQPQRLAVT